MFEEIPAIRPNYDQPNYDEEKVAPYTLEDPLTFADGTKLTSPEQWPRRRAEILDIFAREMYGQEPPKPETQVVEKVEECPEALAGFAVRSQYQMWFKQDKSGPSIRWVVFRPRYAKQPVPVILFLNYRGNHELVYDPEIPVPKGWLNNGLMTDGHCSSEKTRGIMCDPRSDSVFHIGMLLARLCGHERLLLSLPDPSSRKLTPNTTSRILRIPEYSPCGKRDESRTDNPTALGAGLGVSRGLDLAEQIPELDASKSVVTGCSRLGKAAPSRCRKGRTFRPVACRTSAAAVAFALQNAISGSVSEQKCGYLLTGIAKPTQNTRRIPAFAGF